ncbi:restriction endonuclease, SacI family [Leminorella grimontii]|uniref:restriction endonuclease, SacI family n=1 Tax=Leminorella grimontii TaxID=82981 RepID=UPI00321F635D
MKIKNSVAEHILREESSNVDNNIIDFSWVEKIELFSHLCEECDARTHIAFLGTSCLAKAVNKDVDLYAIKPTHSPNNLFSYSARSLCHNILVPLSAELGFSIGTTGREPLNNQPYFRMRFLNDGTPVRQSALRAFSYMLELIDELQKSTDENVGRKALCAFIKVRKNYQIRHADFSHKLTISPRKLTSIITTFVNSNSESGKRAQAVVAGLMDTWTNSQYVESGRINDPSRHYPGDVCIRDFSNNLIWQKAIEVRDKPVTKSDVIIFCRKCIDNNIKDACIVMASQHQTRLDEAKINSWANQYGVDITFFYGWDILVDQILFWSNTPKLIAANYAIDCINERLKLVEVHPTSLIQWQSLILEKE